MTTSVEKAELIEFAKAQVVLHQLKLMERSLGPFLEDNKYCDCALAQRVLQSSVDENLKSKYLQELQELLLNPDFLPEFDYKFLCKPEIDSSSEKVQKAVFLIGLETAKIIFGESDENSEVVEKALSTLSLCLLRTLRPQQIRLNTTFLDALDQDTFYVQKIKEWHSLFDRIFISHLNVSEIRLEDRKKAVNVVSELREVGNNLMANLAYPQAIMIYTQAIDAANHSCDNFIPQLLTNRAIAFIGLNCFPEAITDLNAATKKDPTFTSAWAQLGYCQLYMGKSLEAMECYLQTLRTLAGEIYPKNFPDDERAKQLYTEAKLQSVFPQFVQRVAQAVILTEKRANQQRISPDQIRDLTIKVRAILARFRANSSPEDMHYFAYCYDNDFETMRSTAARANRHRPSILTPEVAQDIMASGSMEASAVTIPFPGFNRQRNPATTNNGPAANNDGNNRRNNSETRPNNGPPGPNSGDTESSTSEGRNEGRAENNEDFPLRGLFNNLGDIFGDVIQAQTLNFFPNDAPRPEGQGPNLEIQVEALGPENHPVPLNQRVPDVSRGATQEERQTETPETARGLPSRADTSPAAPQDPQRDGAEPRRGFRDFSSHVNNLWGNYGRVFDNYLRNQDRPARQGNQSPQAAHSSGAETQQSEGDGAEQPSGSQNTRPNTEDADMPDAPDVD